VVQGYGLSEAAPLVSVLGAANVLTKLGSAGRPAMFVDTRIGGTDGADCGPGEIGELFVRGPNVMTAYWRRPDDTRRAIGEDGWLRTGDAAFVDNDGFLFIVGRMSDAYVSRGQVVHPGFAERVLLEQPSVAEACVIGSEAGIVPRRSRRRRARAPPAACRRRRAAIR
jgi:acyl-CoA synthetase (AMP-forming)/AMP-acid ligase II